VELLQGRDMTDEEFEQYKQSRAAEYTAMKNKNKEQVLKYNDKINKAFQKQVEQNLDPQLKEYYDNKTITELLAM
jgi:DNA anti-recombination protein RmuC